MENKMKVFGLIFILTSIFLLTSCETDGEYNQRIERGEHSGHKH